VRGEETLAKLANGFIFLLAKPEFFSHLASWREVIRTPGRLIMSYLTLIQNVFNFCIKCVCVYCFQINECYLFHGTRHETVKWIARDGMDNRFGNQHSLLGPGLYTAESSTKSDQYAGNRVISRVRGKQTREDFACGISDRSQYCHFWRCSVTSMDHLIQGFYLPVSFTSL
jgi:hypothetical protein